MTIAIGNMIPRVKSVIFHEIKKNMAITIMQKMELFKNKAN